MDYYRKKSNSSAILAYPRWKRTSPTFRVPHPFTTLTPWFANYTTTTMPNFTRPATNTTIPVHSIDLTSIFPSLEKNSEEALTTTTKTFKTTFN